MNRKARGRRGCHTFGPPTVTLFERRGHLSMNRGKTETISDNSPTVTPTNTFTATITPTPTVGSLSVLAAPNVSRNGQPIEFQINLPKASLAHLTLYSLLGEQIYQAAFRGNTGLNTFSWNVQNQANQMVASGLYLYRLQTDDGIKMGKVAVIR